MVMIQFRFFYRSDVFQDPGIRHSVKKAAGITFKREYPARKCLEMMMVGSRCPAFWPVVHKSIPGKGFCHVQHVDIPLPDGLRAVPVHCQHKMLIENRIGIDKDVVFPSFPALELESDLLFRTVFTAQEAFSAEYRLSPHISRCRDYSCRIMLHLDLQPSCIQSPDACIFQCTVIVPRQRPDRELVIGKIVQLLLFHFACLLFNFILASISHVLSLSL